MKRVLITGVSSGIGHVLMTECLNAGHEVVGVVRRSEQRDALLQENPGGLQVQITDLSQAREVSALIRALDDQRFDYVVLNAGCADVGSFAELPEESIESVMQTNLLSNMHIVRALIPNALKHGTKIAFVSSVCARLPGIRFASYAVSKAGLSQLYKSLAVEYPSLVFLCLELGGIETPFHAKAGYQQARKRKSAQDVGKRIYRAMLNKKGMCTLAADSWVMRWLLITFEGSVVRLLRWKEGRSK